MRALYLRVWRRDAPERVREIKLEGDTFQIGRDWDNQVRVDEEGVSRHHAQIRLGEDGVTLVDRGSTNGTWVRGERVQSCRLEVGDTFAVGAAIVELSDCSFSAGTVSKVPVDNRASSPQPPEPPKPQGEADFHLRWRSLGDPNATWSEAPIRCSPFRIGRDSERSDLTLPDPKVSRAHAGIEKDPDGFAIVDYQSSNGVLLNGTRVERQRINPGDRLQIAQFELIFDRVGHAGDIGAQGSEVRPALPAALPAPPPPAAAAAAAPPARPNAHAVDSEITCPWCASKLPSNALFCGGCGGELARAQAPRGAGDRGLICPACGVVADDRERFCGSCGQALPGGAAPTP